jgi:citrate synthase
MDPRLLEKSPLTKSTVVLVELSRWYGKDRFSIPRRASVSGGRPFQNARNCFRRPLVERSLCQKVGYYASIERIYL